jgi:hypothetical protein
MDTLDSSDSIYSSLTEVRSTARPNRGSPPPRPALPLVEDGAVLESSWHPLSGGEDGCG